jgi:gamma-glutamyltranspeptidase
VCTSSDAENVAAAKACYELNKSNLYSDAFCLFYNATTRSVKALNGSGRAPEKLSIEYLRSHGITGRIPPTDLNSVTVPGLWVLKQRYTAFKVLMLQVPPLHGSTLWRFLEAGS